MPLCCVCKRECVCACARDSARARMCVCVCMCACVWLCVYVWVWVCENGCVRQSLALMFECFTWTRKSVIAKKKTPKKKRKGCAISPLPPPAAAQQQQQQAQVQVQQVQQVQHESYLSKAAITPSQLPRMSYDVIRRIIKRHRNVQPHARQQRCGSLLSTRADADCGASDPPSVTL